MDVFFRHDRLEYSPNLVACGFGDKGRKPVPADHLVALPARQLEKMIVGEGDPAPRVQ